MPGRSLDVPTSPVAFPNSQCTGNASETCLEFWGRPLFLQYQGTWGDILAPSPKCPRNPGRQRNGGDGFLLNTVVIRGLGAIANTIHVCGGEFFIRRFKTDGPQFLRLLSSRTVFQADKSMLLPFRKGGNLTDQADMAEGTLLKVQEALFLMIAAIARDKKSACALEAIFKQMVGLAVGFSCGSRTLQKAAADALLSLSRIDIDHVWLLLADIVYSRDGRKVPSPSCSGLPEIAQLLPESPKEYLWVQYAGQNYGLDADFLLASKLLEKIDACHHTDVGQ